MLLMMGVAPEVIVCRRDWWPEADDFRFQTRYNCSNASLGVGQISELASGQKKVRRALARVLASAGLR